MEKETVQKNANTSTSEIQPSNEKFSQILAQSPEVQGEAIDAPQPIQKPNKKIFLIFLIAATVYLIVLQILFSTFNEQVYSLIIIGLIPKILGNTIIEGLSFYYYFIAPLLLHFVFDIVFSIIIVFLLYPKQKLKYFLISLVLLQIVSFSLGLLGAGQTTNQKVTNIKQEQSFEIISETYTKEINQDVAYLNFQIKLSNNQQEPISGKVSAHPQDPYISAMPCEANPSKVVIQPGMSQEIFLKCSYRSVAQAMNEEESPILKLMYGKLKLPEQLDFQLTVYDYSDENSRPKHFSFKSQPHDWEQVFSNN